MMIRDILPADACGGGAWETATRCPEADGFSTRGPAKIKSKKCAEGGLNSGSPCAAFFANVPFLRLLTEGLQYQRVIKEYAVPGEVQTASRHISQGPSRAVCVAKHVANVS
jgi:hypothetical protein